jgi:hypothetical protein
VEVWDRSGKVEHPVARLPLAEQVPIGGVPAGPRAYEWVPTEPATLVWAEALDGGDPKRKVPHRDSVRMHAAPFTGAARELAKTEHRYAGLNWFESGDLAFLSDYDRDRLWRRTFLLNLRQPAAAPSGGQAAPRLVWDRSVNDRYNAPGSPMTRRLPNGRAAIWRSGDSIYLDGEGASPEGSRPFLDRFNL